MPVLISRLTTGSTLPRLFVAGGHLPLVCCVHPVGYINNQTATTGRDGHNSRTRRQTLTRTSEDTPWYLVALQVHVAERGGGGEKSLVGFPAAKQVPLAPGRIENELLKALTLGRAGRLLFPKTVSGISSKQAAAPSAGQRPG